MKETTKKILLALYTDNKHELVSFPLKALSSITPELSQEGRRSLLYLLSKRGLVHTFRLADTQHISATAEGNYRIKEQFPALLDVSELEPSNWLLIVFKDAPKGDKEFRYLRKKLIEEGCMQIARGVYLSFKKMTVSLNHTLQTLYKASIYIFSIKEWYFGSEKPIIFDFFHLSDTSAEYSSISRDADRLLAIFNAKKRLNSKYNDDVCKMYVRWFEILSEDSGLMQYYFPQEVSGKDVLKKIQQLFILL